MIFVFSPAGPLLFAVSVAMLLAACWLFYATRAFLTWCHTSPAEGAATARALLIGSSTSAPAASLPAPSERGPA